MKNGKYYVVLISFTSASQFHVRPTKSGHWNIGLSVLGHSWCKPDLSNKNLFRGQRRSHHFWKIYLSSPSPPIPCLPTIHITISVRLNICQFGKVYRCTYGFCWQLDLGNWVKWDQQKTTWHPNVAAVYTFSSPSSFLAKHYITLLHSTTMSHLVTK